MIIYHPFLGTQFTKYGILIPIVDTRSSKTFELIQKSFPGEFIETNLDSLPSICEEDLKLCHDEAFVKNLTHKSGIENELLKTYELVDENGKYHRYDPTNAEINITEMYPEIINQVAATYLNVQTALEKGFSFFLGGGMHHAMSFGGRGFCPLNDIVISIKKAKKEGLLTNAFVIDIDAHKGDGTAELTQNDPSLLTLSIHMEKGWPLDGPKKDEKGNLHPWFLPNNIDIEIDKGEEKDYIPKLKEGLIRMLKMNKKSPELAVVVAGADPYELDELPSTKRLNLTKEQMLERDMLVFNFLKENNIPQAWVMAGGYGAHSYEIYTQFLEKVLPLVR